MDKPGSMFVVYIVTTAEKLWQALTNSEFTRLYFFGRSIVSDWKTGSPWKMLMDDGRIDSQGRILECEPPRRLSLTWRVEWIEEYRSLPETQMTYQIDLLGDVVRLTVSEFHHPDLEEKYKEGGRKGWPVILSGLKTLLETGRPMPSFKLPEVPTE